MLSRGELSRGIISNLLPVETKEATARMPLSLGDFRFALGVGGDCAMGQMPTVVKEIMCEWPEGVLEGWGRHPDEMEEEEDEMEREGPRTNLSMTNGIHVNSVSTNDNESYGWEGGSAKDRAKIHSVLDDCLAFGQ